MAKPDSAAPTSQPIIRQPFKCASCGSEFFDHHSCPTMPWGSTAPGPIFIQVPTIVVKA